MSSQTQNNHLISNHSTLKSWVVCIAASLFFAYELMQMHMLNSIAPMLMRDLGITGALFGYLGATYLLADVIFLIPAGVLLDRLSPRKIIMTALVICIIGTVGFAYSQSFFQAALSHFLSGIGNAFCFLSCMMFVSRWFEPKKQAFAVGVVVTLGMLGGVLAQSPFSFLAEALSWRKAMLVNASIGCLILCLIFFLVQDAPVKLASSKKAETKLSKQLKTAILHKPTILAGLYTGLVNLPLMILGAMWGSLFLTQIHHLSLNKATFITGMICTGTIVGSSLFGYLSDRLGKRKPLMLIGAAGSLAILCLILFSKVSIPFVLLVLFFLLGLLSSSQVLGYPVITQTASHECVGTSMGVAAVIIMGLAGLMQPLSGILLDLFWDKTILRGTPIYTHNNFLLCLSILPIGLIVSYFIASELKESPNQALEN